MADVAEEAITVDGQSRPLVAGMVGRAEILLGRRTLLTYAFEPLRKLRENLRGEPPGSRDRD